MTLLNPSSLPGSHRTRVFVGGSYQPKTRLMLSVIENAVRDSGFEAILADQFGLIQPELDVHDVTLFLLHSCRIAIFEMSGLSGALMELERCADYGINHVLVLYNDPFGRAWPADRSGWDTSAMVKAMVRENRQRFKIRSYVRPKDAASHAQRFLRAIRRSEYGKLHSLR